MWLLPLFVGLTIGFGMSVAVFPLIHRRNRCAQEMCRDTAELLQEFRKVYRFQLLRIGCEDLDRIIQVLRG